MEPKLLFDVVLLLLAAAVPLALLARRFGIPPSVAFVLGGMLLTVLPNVPQVELDPALAMALFLPPLLQASAYRTVWRDFRANLRPILMLAIGTVIFTTVVVAVIARFLVPDLPLAACLTLGAIVAPPDAVAVASVLERLPVPRRLATILEGESLVNDASALVIYRYATAATLAGAFHPQYVLASLVLVTVGGVAVGFALGQASVWLFRRLHDTQIEIAASFLVSWASYLAAEAIDASGVLAVVTCGLVLGWHRSDALSSASRLAGQATWAFVVFMLDAMVFILIGFSLNGVLTRIGDISAARLLPLAAAVAGGVIVARFLSVVRISYLPLSRRHWRRGREAQPPPGEVVVTGWAGIRGVVSLAAALALPDDFPGHDEILVVSFTVILVTLLLQGTTLGPLIRALGLATGSGGAAQDMLEARRVVDRAALGTIEQVLDDPLEGAIARDLLPAYQQRLDLSSTADHGARAAVLGARLALHLRALAAARQALIRLQRAGNTQDDVLHALEEQIDLEETRLRRRLEIL